MQLRPLEPGGARPFDFAAIGESSLDDICLCRELPSPDSKTQLVARYSLPGGQAATAAAGVSRLGFRSRYAGVVGDDAAGRAVCTALTNDGVDARVVVRAGTPTRTAVIIIDEQGRRCVLGARDPRLNTARGEIADDVFTSARILLVDGSDLELAQRAAAAARAAGVATLCDLDEPGRDALDLLKHIDVAILPADFARCATGLEDVAKAAAELVRRYGPPVVTVTDGVHGAATSTVNDSFHTPAEPIQAVDSTGAGDAFRAGFVAAWLLAEPGAIDLRKAMAFAARVAALNCRKIGAMSGLPTAAEAGLPGEGRV